MILFMVALKPALLIKCMFSTFMRILRLLEIWQNRLRNSELKTKNFFKKRQQTLIKSVAMVADLIPHQVHLAVVDLMTLAGLTNQAMMTHCLSLKKNQPLKQRKILSPIHRQQTTLYKLKQKKKQGEKFPCFLCRLGWVSFYNTDVKL